MFNIQNVKSMCFVIIIPKYLNLTNNILSFTWKIVELI